jgi:hypothetical protein
MSFQALAWPVDPALANSGGEGSTTPSRSILARVSQGIRREVFCDIAILSFYMFGSQRQVN